MNKLLLLFFTIIGVNLNFHSQEQIGPQKNDSYFNFRSQNMFSIVQSSDAKLKGYIVLNTIELIDSQTKEKTSLTPEEFIIKFNAGEINSNFISIKRERYSDTWYKLGNTDYILIGYSEDQISTRYNQTIKK